MSRCDDDSDPETAKPYLFVVPQGDDGPAGLTSWSRRPISAWHGGCGPTVLLSGGDGIATLATARALHAAGCRVHLATTERRYASRSRAVAHHTLVIDPARDAKAFAADVASAAWAQHVDVVVPTTEAALVALCQASEVFPPSTVVASCDPHELNEVLDKELATTAAAGCGLATLPTTYWTVEMAASRAAELRFPVVIKTRRSDLPDGSGGLVHHAPRYVNGPDELTSAIGALPERGALVQPFVAGTLLSYSGVHHHGQLLDVVAAEVVRTWPQPCGEFSFARTIETDPAIMERLGRLANRLGWHGLFQVDLMVHDGVAYFLDFNPRPYTSMALSITAGRNQPATWIAKLLGIEGPGQPETHGYEVGLGYRITHRDLRALWAVARRDGARSAARSLVPPRRVVSAIATIRDPGPLLGIPRLSRLRRRIVPA